MKKLIILTIALMITPPIAIYSVYSRQSHDSISETSSSKNNSKVLGASDEELFFAVNIPATFNKDISAPNVVYSVNSQTGEINIDNSLIAGSGIEVEGRTINNTGILTIVAGDGIDIDGNKVTNSGILSLEAGDGIDVDGNKISNTYNVDLTASGWTDNGSEVVLTTTTDTVTVGGLTFDNATITSGSSILPDTDLGSDLGSSSKRFNNLWVANLNSNSSTSFAGQTTFSYPPQDTTISEASVLINPTTSAASGQLLGLGVAGYQRAMIDEDGDITLGYSDATSAPASDHPLNIYGHNGTRVAFVDTSGNGHFGGNIGIGMESSSSKLSIKGSTTDNTASSLTISDSDDVDFLNIKNDASLTLGKGISGNIPQIILNGYYSGSTKPVTIRYINDDQIGISTHVNTSVNQLILGQSPSWNNVGYISAGGNYLQIVGGAANKTGIGLPTNTLPNNTLDVANNMAIGSYAGSNNAPSNSLIVSGNVGIGTTAPLSILDVHSSGFSTFAVSSDRNTADLGIGGLRFYAKDSANNDDLYATINAKIVDPTSGSEDASLEFWGMKNGTAVQHMTIDEDGGLGIGTTNPEATLHIEDGGSRYPVIRLRHSDATAGKLRNISIAPNNTITIYNESYSGVYMADGASSWTGNSDEILKKNIIELENPLEKISQIRGVNFNWKDPNISESLQLGVIAQDVQAVFPEIVTEHNGVLGVQYDKLGVLALAGINELVDNNISDIETRTTFIETIVESIKDQLETIEEKLAQLTEEIFSKKVTTQELCIEENDKTTCLTRNQVDKLMELLPEESPAPTTDLEPSTETSDSATLIPTPEPSSSPTATESAN